MSRVVYTPGVWDLLHIGHLNIIREAKSYGDRLVVGVCSDEITKETKECWPAIQEAHRAELVASIRYVDGTYVYSNLDKSAQLAKFDVSVFVVGEEFGSQGIKEHAVALDYCKRNDVQVIRVGRFKGISTTLIKENLK